MKKILLSLLSIVYLSIGASAQDIVNLRQDAKSMNLRGSVASIDEDMLVRKEYFREDWPERKWFRDDLRNCLREESGNVYTFNQQGQMVSHTYTLRGANLRTTTCAYQNGRLSQLQGEGCKVVRNGKDLDIYAESTTFSNPSLTKSKEGYAFDYKCRLEWADDGQLLASRYYFVDSTPAKAFEYQYNHRGQISEMTALVYAAHGQVESKTVTRYTYDSRDCLQRVTVRGESVDDTYTYENNDQGDPIRMVYSTPYATTVYEYEYQYDDHDNWTMRLQWKEGLFETATLRAIRYQREAKASAKSQAQAETEEVPQVQPKAKAAKAPKEPKAKAEKAPKEPKAKAEKAPKEPKAKAEKAPKEPKAKAEKAPKEPKVKAEKAPKEPKAKAEKAPKEPKAKAEKAPKEPKAKAEKAPKEPKAKAKEDIPDELQTSKPKKGKK